MGASATQIAQLRRITAEPTTTNYSDETLTGFLEAHPLPDQWGELPYLWDASTTPPSKTDNPIWVEDYDVYAAAVDVWEDKMAKVAQDYNFQADGGSLNREAVFNNYRKMAAYCKSKRKVVAASMGLYRPSTYTGVINKGVGI